MKDLTVFSAEPKHSIVTVAKIVYGLHALSILIGIAAGGSIIGAFLFSWPAIVAVMINFFLRSEARGTYVDSHFGWQLRTVFYGFLWTLFVGLIGFILSFVAIGFALWFIGFAVLGVWVAYRVCWGWYLLVNEKPV